MPDTKSKTTAAGGLDAALRRAREYAAAHYEAAFAVRDAEILRLEALKLELAPLVAAHERARAYFDLAIIPGEPPRLWLDLLGSVTMAPDPRSYRLTQDLPGGREILLETADRAEMVEKIKDYMAFRLIDRDRQLAAARPLRDRIPTISGWTVAAAALAGFAGGAMVLWTVLKYLKKISF